MQTRMAASTLDATFWLTRQFANPLMQTMRTHRHALAYRKVPLKARREFATRMVELHPTTWTTCRLRDVGSVSESMLPIISSSAAADANAGAGPEQKLPLKVVQGPNGNEATALQLDGFGR